jgi:hypothetical protein
MTLSHACSHIYNKLAMVYLANINYVLHAFSNLSDFGAKCKNCGTINTIPLEKGELKKQNNHKPPSFILIRSLDIG